jgi:hypothetical protein
VLKAGAARSRGGSIELLFYLVEIEGRAGAAAFHTTTGLAAEVLIYQPGHIKGGQNKNQEYNELLNHDKMPIYDFTLNPGFPPGTPGFLTGNI